MPTPSESITSKLTKLRDALRVHGSRVSREELAKVRSNLKRLSDYADQLDSLHEDPFADDPEPDDPFAPVDKPAPAKQLEIGD